MKAKTRLKYFYNNRQSSKNESKNIDKDDFEAKLVILFYYC